MTTFQDPMIEYAMQSERLLTMVLRTLRVDYRHMTDPALKTANKRCRYEVWQQLRSLKGNPVK